MADTPGSRHQALAICRSAGPHTVGAVIARILTSPAVNWTVRYELASGDIGAFYSRPDIRAIINSPWTDDNLRELARRETLFFHTQSGSAGVVGQLLGENGRFNILQMARDYLF